MAEQKCPSCARTTKEDLDKFDITLNPWVSFEALWLAIRSIRRYPVRTLIVFFGVPGALICSVSFLRFILVPSQIASNAPGAAKVGATVASFVRSPVVNGVVQTSAFMGQPVTTQEVQAINAAPSAMQVGFGTTTPFANNQGGTPAPAGVKTTQASNQW